MKKLLGLGISFLMIGTATAAEFVVIPHGEFYMGSGRSNEPYHHVTITKDFEMQTALVTQKEWYDVSGYNATPALYTSRDHCPNDYLVIGFVQLCPQSPFIGNWSHAGAYAYDLNQKADGYYYRLPTEAEWEYAAKIHGSKLQQMIGSGGQWVSDFYSEYYGDAVASRTTDPRDVRRAIDPQGPVQWDNQYYEKIIKGRGSYASHRQWISNQSLPLPDTLDVGIRIVRVKR